MRSTTFTRLALCAIAFLLFTYQILLAQKTFENVDPTVSQFEIIRGSGDPDYTGALNFKIPLMKIPGRGGLDYDLELSYVHGSGVPASESASWIGLGWNLNLYQISCSPVFAPEGNDAVSSTGKDTYHVSYPGSSTVIYQFADGWRPLDWSAIKIDVVTEFNYSTSGWGLVEKDFKKFTITDVDGKRYIFAERLRQESSKPLTNHCCLLPSCSPHSHSGKHPYFYVFKLSAILGADYVDGSTPADDIPGNGGTDLGSWIKLVYSAPQTISGGISPNIYQMEINYLSQIITPTHTATFNVSSSGNYFIYGGIEDGTQIGILNSIDLSPAGTKVEFFTSRKFGWVRQDGAGGYFLVNQDGYTPGIGYHYFRIGLDSLRMSGGSGSVRIPPYKFEYTGNPTEAHNASVGIDPWGYYTLQSGLLQPTEADVKWTVWLLKKAIYPTGGTVEYEYETNRFQTYYNDFRGSTGDTEILAGGVRLKKQTLTDPLTQQASVYQYKYALTNKRHPGGYGLLSSEPLAFGLGVPVQNSVGKNLRTEVHYPDVEITRPDGSKVRKYYSSAFSSVKDQGSYPYVEYQKCNNTINVQNDADLQNITINPGDDLYTIFYTNCLNLGSNCALDETCKNFNSTSCYKDYPPPNNTAKDAFLGEASEFDDNVRNLLSGCSGNYVQVPLFSNGWKRGRLTYEEFYQAPSGNPALDTTAMNVTIYSYNMVGIKSERYTVTYNYSCNGGGSSPTSAFVTSGWAQLKKVEAQTRLNPNLTTLSLIKKEEYQYNTTNGLFKRQADTNSDGTKRLTSLKYPTDYTTSPANDDYVKAIDSLKTRQIYNAVIQKVIRQQKAGQTDSSVYAAELVKYKKTPTNQILPFESFQFDTTAFLNLTDSQLFNITGGLFTKHAQYKRQITYDAYDAHGNLTLTKDASSLATPTGTIWAYNNTLPVAQVRNATPANSAVSIFDDGNTSGWANGAGTWVVGNGAYQQTDSLPNSITQPQRYNNLTLDDAVFEADVRFDNVTKPQRLALCKYINGSNFVRFVLRRETSNPVVRIYAQKGASYKIVDAAKTFNSKQWYHLRGEIQGSTAKLYLDGDLLLTVTDPTVDHDAGKIGLGTELSQASFDNVRFYPPGALVVSRSYDPGFFTVNTRTDENGMPRRFTFDALGRLKTVQDALGNLVRNTAYYHSSPFSTSNPNYIKTTLATNAALHGRNHDFESGAGSQPDYWIGEVIGTTCSGCAAAWDNTAGFSGAKSIKAHIPAAGADSRVRWMPNPWYDEKVSPKETYRMEVWVKTTNGYNGNAQFILWFHNSAHGFTESPTITIPAGDREWTKYTLDFTPLPATDHLYTIYLDFASNNQYKGTVWYDRPNFYELNITKTFADGVGRGVQTLQYQGDNSSVQVATIFDALSRVSKVTKPFFSADTFFTPAYNPATQTYPPIDSANTWYSSSAGNHPAYYEGATAKDFDTDPYAYSEAVYYNDPLDRLQKQAAPGTAFRMGTGREVKFHFFGNASGEAPTYAANTLMKQRRTDENGNVVSTFTDNFGHTITTIVDSAGLAYKTTFQYDVLGNLLKSKAPKGDSTTYAFNTLSQLRQKITPDAGTTEYLYDQNGNLRFVKDANGATGNYFIYYKYDAFNRKIEEGKANSLASFRQDSANIAAFPTTGYTWKVKYHYDVAGYTAGAPQRNLRGRMDAIEYVIDRYPNMKGYIFYSYDNNGNVEWIQQFIPKSNINDGNGNLVAKIDYAYDALGKVTKMSYRRTFPPGGPSDAFHAWYDYDALGRLEKVFANAIDLKTDPPAAQYTYWPSGQVRRVVLGNNLQGVDYLYNSRDWLTQINHQNLYYTQDPGGDGGAGVPNPDRFGQVIGYDRQKQIAVNSGDFVAQYNGNISWTVHNTHTNINPVNSGITGWVFKYDQANRLKKANWGYWGGSPASWVKSYRYDLAGPTGPDSLIEYDQNGNLKKMLRYNENNVATSMIYNYLGNTNKLDYIGGLNGQTSGNYTYDPNGNMIKDVIKLGSANTISYDYRNLPYKIPKTNGTIDFGYDGKGRRVSKNNFVYVPGADGRVIAVYDLNGTLLYWNIWGLDLIGQRFWKQ